MAANDRLDRIIWIIRPFTDTYVYGIFTVLLLIRRIFAIISFNTPGWEDRHGNVDQAPKADG